MYTWDDKFFRIALETAGWSKHPYVKVGCVLVGPDNNMAVGGYNGLPRKINDARILNQANPVSSTVHAEGNAIAAAARNGIRVLGTTAYVTRPICAACSSLLIQAGVVKVKYIQQDVGEKWQLSCTEALNNFCEAGVGIRAFYPHELNLEGVRLY